MPTIKQLKNQIARENAKKKKAQTKIDLEVKKANLQLELKRLQRKPSTSRNIKLAKRTGRGLKVIGKKTFKVIKKQAILIKQQQLRDQARARKEAKKLSPKTKLVKRIEITGKGKKKRRKVIFERKKIKVKTKQPSGNDFFGGLSQLNI